MFNLKHGRKPSAETARRVLGASISVIDCAERNVPGCCGVRVFLNYSSFSREEDITCLCRNISHVNSCAVWLVQYSGWRSVLLLLCCNMDKISYHNMDNFISWYDTCQNIYYVFCTIDEIKSFVTSVINDRITCLFRCELLIFYWEWTCSVLWEVLLCHTHPYLFLTAHS